MGKRSLYQSKHPFSANPFEALWSGAWWPVELIRVSSGYLNICSTDGRYVHENCGPNLSLRIRSRRATPVDCICFLRSGVDVCVLSGKGSKQVWVDARISSVERKPHSSGCLCQYHVKLYVSECPLGSERGVLSKETIIMGIDNISILQRLEPPQIEGQLHRWATSEDSFYLPRTKLLSGKFLSDLSWLLVVSVVKRVIFVIRSVNEKLVYQFSDTEDSLKTVNFKKDGNMLESVIFEQEDSENAKHSEYSLSLQTISDMVELRRSTRRNVQPDRFIGCDVSELQIDPFRSGLLRNDKWKEEIDEEEEMSLPLAVLYDVPGEGCHGDLTKHKCCAISEKSSPLKSLVGAADKPMEEKERGDSSAAYDDVKIAINHITKPCCGRKRSRKSNSELVLIEKDYNMLSLEQYKPQTKDTRARDRSGEGGSHGGGSVGSGYTYSVPYYTAQKFSEDGGKSRRDLEETNVCHSWVRNASHKKADDRKNNRLPAKRKYMNEKRIHGPRSLSAGLYKDMINSYMKSIDSTKMKDNVPIIEECREFQARTNTSNRKETILDPVTDEQEEEEEESEMDMLWREMEFCMTSSYLFEDKEGPRADKSNEHMKKAMNVCPHDFKLDEEIGIYCKLCGTVRIEIKDILPDFIHTTYVTTDNKDHHGYAEHKQADDEGLDISYKAPSSDMNIPEENRNVWSLIPDLRKKLHMHQRKAFEFLWRNVSGSLIPAQMDFTGKKTGGCVVSHTPGAGKTFLIISFLVSYLKLFPGIHPLVLAPKTTLYTWHKEFFKWQIPIPVYLIHGRRSWRVFRQDMMEFEGLPKPGQDVMHVLDCLDKIQKWLAQPSVLVMGYTSFLTMMREKTKFAHRKHMAKVLRESPGILILDEGHNPRSTKSRLRKVLMKIETDTRILLSGTLFQNNFCEYFNTLCLARPKFVYEVLKELDPKYKRKKKKSRNLLETQARKFFIDNIGKKIDSKNGDERMQGLSMLRNMTAGFIDAFEGGIGDTLPGLQSYTLLMNPTDIQLQILVKLHQVLNHYNGFPLELELLITLVSIHPWLVKTVNCAGKFLSTTELAGLDKHKFDIKKGSKVKFVLSLVYRVFQKEKTLIFCHNIAPIRLLLELFENIFGWKKGKEVLVLSGDLELFERGRVIDQFEDPGSPSRVMIASIMACAEGISLTAASRVILLDSEWNPSKTKQAIARAFRPGQQKMVYVYQLLAANTLEEDKYRRTTWKEWVSCMIFSEAFVEDPSKWQAQKLEDEILREMVKEDRSKAIHMIMKNEKASTN